MQFWHRRVGILEVVLQHRVDTIFHFLNLLFLLTQIVLCHAKLVLSFPSAHQQISLLFFKLFPLLAQHPVPVYPTVTFTLYFDMPLFELPGLNGRPVFQQ